MADKKKRFRLRGIKKTTLEPREIFRRTHMPLKNPDILRPKCAGKCFFCLFNKLSSVIDNLEIYQGQSDTLVKYAE